MTLLIYLAKKAKQKTHYHSLNKCKFFNGISRSDVSIPYKAVDQKLVF